LADENTAEAARAFHQLSCYGWFDEPACSPLPPELPRPAPAAPAIPGLLVDTIRSRRSHREFSGTAVPLASLQALLWATYGRIPSEDFERRTVPSAGGLYPLEPWVVAQRVEGLEAGIYRYDGGEDKLEPQPALPLPTRLGEWLRTRHVDLERAAAVVFLVGALDPIASRYGERGYRYLLLEAGHAAQNLCLAATALAVRHVPVGGFDDERVKQGLGVGPERWVLYAVVLGQ
jgi:SagB-type dehydrogenase family enzyme